MVKKIKEIGKKKVIARRYDQKKYLTTDKKDKHRYLIRVHPRLNGWAGVSICSKKIAVRFEEVSVGNN